MKGFFAFVVTLIYPLTASASISAPTSHATLSPDGGRILVMRSYAPEYEREHPQYVTFLDGQTFNICDTFPRSGVYDTVTLAPIWQVDWFSFEPSLRWSDDFRHVVRHNFRGRDSTWALAFYEDGKLTREYDCDQLLTTLKHHRYLRFTSGDWHTIWYDDFDLAGDRVTLSTLRRQIYLGFRIDLGLQEFYTFDLATGAMLARRSTGAWYIHGYAAVVLATLLFAVFGTRRAWRRVTRHRRAQTPRLSRVGHYTLPPRRSWARTVATCAAATTFLLVACAARSAHTHRTKSIEWRQAHRPDLILGRTFSQLRATLGHAYSADRDPNGQPMLIYTDHPTCQRCVIRFDGAGVAVTASISPW